jgi:hypothetical protein
MEHRLFKQLAVSDATEEEVKELYDDLDCIFRDPFDNSGIM